MDAALRQTLLGNVLQSSRGARYRLAELIGESRKGWIFRATSDAAPHAPTFQVIVHRPDVIPSDAIEGFSEEAETLRAALGLLSATSRELVNLHDHGVHVVPHECAALPLGFAVREEFSGQSLAKVIAAHGGFGVPVARARRLAGHVARGLFALHEVGVVHRDLTPTNVLIVQENGQERARLVDYAFAAALAPHAIEPSSIGYAPPERLGYQGAPIGPASDVFSFAVILFEALSGTEAFSRGDPTRVVMQMVQGERPTLARVRATLPAELRDKPELVAALDREIGRATKPEPAQRHASIRELWAALEPLLREVVRPQASGGAVAVEDPVSFDGFLPRSASSPDLAPRTGPPPSVAMPASAARSGPAPLAAPMPVWQVAGPPIPNERLHAAVLVEQGRALLAVGSRGLHRLTRGVWSPAPLPAGIDGRLVRGVLPLPSGDLALFGATGLCTAITARGQARRIAPEVDATWHAAHVDEEGIVLVGERLSRPAGVALLLPNAGKPIVHVMEATSRLTAVTRLEAGPILVAGLQGALALVDASGFSDVAWGRTGHLSAIARGPASEAYAVGSGGHALRVGVDRTSGRIAATLEGVQTTRDLAAVAVDPSRGSAWAAGADARLLERRGDVWVRVPLDPSVTSALVRVFPGGGRIMVLAEDGLVFSCELSR